MQLEQRSTLSINNNQVQAADITNAADKKAAAEANQKAMEAAKKAKESWKKVQQVTKEDKPAHEEKIQTQSAVEKSLVVQIEAVKKPEGASKIQELAAMEEALRKATEEAHTQRLALQGTTSEGMLAQAATQSRALADLK